MKKVFARATYKRYLPEMMIYCVAYRTDGAGGKQFLRTFIG